MVLRNSELQARIDALLRADDFGRANWLSAGSDTPFVITYQFETFARNDFPWSDVADPVAYSATDQAGVRAALEQFEAVLNIDFVEVTGENDPILSFYRSPDIYTGDPSVGWGRGSWGYRDDEWDGAAVFQTSRTISGGENIYLLLHEIGHTLGLKHPGDYDVGGNNPPGPFLPADEDNNHYTLMSYNEDPATGSVSNSLMLYDILALQAWWGSNDRTNAGRDTYRPLDGSELQVIWDGGGQDRLVYQGSGRAVLDLREGAFSSLDGRELAAIAYDAQIENAVGGGNDDLLRGNAARNRLQGNDGDDRLIGDRGNDRLFGGQGRDDLLGGQGRDLLNGRTGNDLMRGGGGRDVFVFSEGADAIADFRAVGRGDRIDLADAGNIRGYGDLIANHLRQSGYDTIIEDGRGNMLTLRNVEIADVTANDFIF